MGKVLCEVCKKKCSGNALRVQDRYFHLDCFKCAECSSSLAQGGFFLNGGLYYCSKDYQKLFGTRCAECRDYVEGDVVTALGNTYHQKCFVCASCRQPFPSGEKVTYTGKDVLCTKCIQIPIVSTDSPSQESQVKNGPIHKICAGCNEELKEGQALIALGKEWHIWCFKCTECEAVLHGEYMDKDGIPYCEKDYQKQFGVKCNHCERYIIGKVLRAGDNHHFHPTCARCSKCGDPFGDGEEMYLQGGAIWHPRCGPSPDGKMDDDYLDDHKSNGLIDGHYPPYSPSLSSSRSTSPYSSLTRQYGRTSPGMFLDKDPLITDLSRVYTLSYLTAEPTQGYLRRPIQPHPPKSPQFHRPPDSSGSGRRRMPPSRPTSKQGMQALGEFYFVVAYLQIKKYVNRKKIENDDGGRVDIIPKKIQTVQNMLRRSLTSKELKNLGQDGKDLLPAMKVRPFRFQDHRLVARSVGHVLDFLSQERDRECPGLLPLQ